MKSATIFIILSVLIGGGSAAANDENGGDNQPPPAAAKIEESSTTKRASNIRDTSEASCIFCPKMVAIPSGSFAMGTKTSKPGFPRSSSWIEQPQHEVKISAPFYISKNEITVSEFLHFANATAKARDNNCPWEPLNMPTTAADIYPAVCVNKNDAEDYAKWLSEKTGFSYRLPSESEWEYVARAGGTEDWYWGDQASMACRFENVADASYLKSVEKISSRIATFSCDDGYLFVSPLGTFAANPFGLNDMLGNVSEWVADCWSDDYKHSPTDGSALTRPGGQLCPKGVWRGGSFISGPTRARAAYRSQKEIGDRSPLTGFRIAR